MAKAHSARKSSMKILLLLGFLVLVVIHYAESIDGVKTKPIARCDAF